MDRLSLVRTSQKHLPATVAALVAALAQFGCCPNAPAAAAPHSAPASAPPATEVEPTAPVPEEPQPMPRSNVAPAPPKPEALRAIQAAAVSAADRDAADVALDEGRKPMELLSFFGVAPGWSVLEIGTGGGYTAELLSRTVGESGKVYGQNSRFLLERFAEAPWSARLKKQVMSNVVRVDREFDAPVPPGVTDLDAVFNVLFYHDTVWQGVDRAAMNRAIFDALAPGGIYGIVDHSAAEGAGTSVTESLHRIEEQVVISEVETAGFRLESRSEFLRNPEDTRDWNASPRQAGDRRGSSDRFVLKFRKP